MAGQPELRLELRTCDDSSAHGGATTPGTPKQVLHEALLSPTSPTSIETILGPVIVVEMAAAIHHMVAMLGLLTSMKFPHTPLPSSQPST